MVLRTITSLADTITSELSPSENYASRPTLTARNVTGRRLLPYLIARGLPDREGGIVNSAVLRLFASESFPSVTVQARQLTSDWPVSSLRWQGQPAGGSVFASKTGSAGIREPFDIEIGNVVQQWLDGSANRGLRLETTSTRAAGVSWYSMNAAGTRAPFRPVLLLDVSYPPNQPTDIAPGNGSTVSTSSPLVTWRYGGEWVPSMVAYQVQTNPNNVWSTPSGDTGEVASTLPQHQLSGLSGNVWFRVRHKSADGRWSEWSSGQQLFFAGRPTVTITSTETVTDDPSPTTTWTVTGGTQTSFQVVYTGLVPGGGTGPFGSMPKPKTVADSGVMVGADTSWAPSAPLPEGTTSIVREVRVWDAVDRVATSGEPAYTKATAPALSIVPATTVTPVAGLSVAMGLGPSVQVSWTRGSTPDEYIVERRIGDGPWVRFRVDPGDVALGGGAYRWTDVTAPPEHELTYRVRPIVNRSLGEAPLEDSIDYLARFIWLADPEDPSWLLPLAGQESGTFDLPEDSAVIEVKGSDRVNIVFESARGYQGDVSGVFVSDVPAMGGRSAQEMRDAVWHIKRNPTKVWRLVISDMNIPVALREPTPVPQSGSELTYGMSVEFYQQGELAWEDAS